MLLHCNKSGAANIDEEIFSVNKIAGLFYPNPAYVGANIFFRSAPPKGHLQITDISGRLVYQLQIPQKQLSVQLPSGLKPGIYLINFYTSVNSNTSKLIITE